jgi:hypothetical protein
MKNKNLIIDIALKSIEDMNPIFDRNHSIIHAGGGNCMDAAMSKVVAMEIAHRAMIKRVPADVMLKLEPVIEEANDKLETSIEQLKEEIRETHSTLEKEFIKMLLKEVFEVEVEDGEFEIEVQNLDREKFH